MHMRSKDGDLSVAQQPQFLELSVETGKKWSLLWRETNMYSDLHKGVYFVEGIPSGTQRIKAISTRIDGCFSGAQLQSLDNIKDIMATEVRRYGGNAVVNFKYAQKSSFWRSLISLDDVRWEASGSIATIDPSLLT